MESLPEPLDRAQNVDLADRRSRIEVWLRRVAILLFACFVLAGLADVFGQRPSDTSAVGDAATLGLRAPSALRSGLIFEARFRIDARRRLASPQLVLDPGWFEGMTLNSIQPDPTAQSERDGRIVFTYGALGAGASLTVRLQWQVNPTSVGSRSQDVALDDHGVPITRIDRNLRIYP